jgi:glycosyltransferase involved in cell wall biosynthesis
LTVSYLLEGTELFGGVKVPLHHANLLAARGHRVTVVSKGDRPDWYPVTVRFLQVESFERRSLPPADVTVATFWTTVQAAADAPSGGAVHYCQGFEASYTHNRDVHPAIIEAYRLPIPCFAVSPHLVTLCRERFHRPGRVVPPALEGYWRPAWRLGPSARPRVLVVSPFEIDWKGVATGMAAVRGLRELGIPCRLIRLSQWPVSSAERELGQADEYHHRLAPKGVARLLRGIDLLLAPSWAQEGFGLPVLEAMASGVPVVASDIPAFRWFAGEAAALVPFDRPERFVSAAREILADRGRWRSLRDAGLRAAKAFSEARVAGIVEEALYWVSEGRWRSEP